jgi:hypothetical protein
MPTENNDPMFEGLNAPTLFREFAAECTELAQTGETCAIPENGVRLASSGAALGKETLSATLLFAARKYLSRGQQA